MYKLPLIASVNSGFSYNPVRVVWGSDQLDVGYVFVKGTRVPCPFVEP